MAKMGVGIIPQLGDRTVKSPYRVGGPGTKYPVYPPLGSGPPMKPPIYPGASVEFKPDSGQYGIGLKEMPPKAGKPCGLATWMIVITSLLLTIMVVI